jgi:Undecaprenyl-phosphate galactose phosphotransferase WbaP
MRQLEPRLLESAKRPGPEAFKEHIASLRRPYAQFLAVLFFLISDCLAVGASALAGHALVKLLGGAVTPVSALLVNWPFLFLFLIGFAINGLYPGLSLAPSEELRRFTLISFLSFLAMTATDIVDNSSWGPREWSLVASFACSVPVLTASRVFTRSRCARTRWWGVPVVIFGAGATGRTLVDRLQTCPWIGYKPAIMLDDDPGLSGWYAGVPIAHPTSLGPEIARSFGVTTAIVAMPGVERRRVAEIIERYAKPFRHIILIPDFIGMTSIWLNVRDFEGYLGLSMSQRLMFGSNRVLKRTVEFFITILGLIIISPLFVLIAIAVKLDSPGPVFYGHKRLGRFEKEFTAWKYRTMRADADAVLESYLAENAEARAEWAEARKLKDDPRITRVGRFLRARSLDELPQFWNVLRGEMSLIGPRPIVREEIEKYGNSWSVVSSITPGVSGLWQVSGRSDTSYPERVELDLYYIRSWSLWMDLYIFFKTIWNIVSGKGAY